MTYSGYKNRKLKTSYALHYICPHQCKAQEVAENYGYALYIVDNTTVLKTVSHS